MALLEVENLAVLLKRPDTTVPIVRRISYTIDRGETLAIVGESGSGKSVSSSAIMGLLPSELELHADRLVFDGEDLVSASDEAMRQLRGRRIAMVFQEPMTALNPVKSIGSQITEGIRLNLGLSRSGARDRAIELLGEVGLSDAEQRLAQFPHNFSGGMRQRVVIAIALSGRPDLIIADEPTTALDVTIQAQILDLMARLCRDHDTALMLITHNLGVVARYAQRVNVMYAGRIVASAEAKSLYARPRHPYTRGLLKAVPRLDRDRSSRLPSIPGAPADPTEPISGCRFHPRCERAGDICREKDPPLENGVACHFPYEDAARLAS